MRSIAEPRCAGGEPPVETRPGITFLWLEISRVCLSSNTNQQESQHFRGPPPILTYTHVCLIISTQGMVIYFAKDPFGVAKLAYRKDQHLRWESDILVVVVVPLYLSNLFCLFADKLSCWSRCLEWANVT